MRPTIHIPTPCAESWAAMTPTSTGRHCAACQKTVIDFTLKTDAEILALLTQAAGKSTCGRFRAEQLGQPLQLPKPSSRWRSWLGAALTLGSLTSVVSPRAAAQSVRISYSGGPEPLVQEGRGSAPATPVPQTSPAAAAPAATPPVPRLAGPLMFRGVVLDANTHEALPGVSVLIKNTTSGASTNEAGESALEISPEHQAEQLQIILIGYAGVEQSVARQAANPSLPVLMEEEVTSLGGDAVIAEYKKPYPWHPRAFFHWTKFWLSRPFRR